MTHHLPQNSSENIDGDNAPELELTEDDILDAMQHIPGYLDITSQDFRSIYHLAHRHALERLWGRITASRLMRTGIPPLNPEMTLDKAARIIADSGYKGLPVVDNKGYVIGMLTESDYLQHLKTESFLELLLKMSGDSFEFKHDFHETTISSVMTQPAITASMPVVDADGKLLGLLLRKDILTAAKLKESK